MSMDNIPTGDNRLAFLSEEVRRGNTMYLAGKKLSHEGAVISGRALAEAKAALPHGAWLPWLVECGVSPRTASRHMQKARLGDAQIGHMADLPEKPVTWDDIFDGINVGQEMMAYVNDMADVALICGRPEIFDKLRDMLTLGDEMNVALRKALAGPIMGEPPPYDRIPE